jgi:hypothetical protein
VVHVNAITSYKGLGNPQVLVWVVGQFQQMLKDIGISITRAHPKRGLPASFRVEDCD